MTNQENENALPSSKRTSPSQSRRYSVSNHRSLTSSKTGNNFYFAYGSNLSHTQMAGRCANAQASSIPVAIVRLDGWKWIICQRGYANVVELPPKTNLKPNGLEAAGTTTTTTKITPQTSVWGVIYDLNPTDEAALDGYEGASAYYEEHPEPNPDPDERERQQRPHLQGDRLYNKLYLRVAVENWLRDPEKYGVKKASPASDGDDGGGGGGVDTITVLVYVDEKRTVEGTIQDSYIGRMNRAIDESVSLGIPRRWVEEVMRRWIPDGVKVQDKGWVGEVPGHESTWVANTEAVW